MQDVVLIIPNDTSKGLSHAIDAKLDADFKRAYGIEDVNLGSSWQSVFTLIQNDQAQQEEGQRSFTEQDNDINKGSHYKVNAGNYVIKGAVWESIVDIAKKVMSKEIQKAEESKKQQTESVQKDDNVQQPENTQKTAAEIIEENKQKISEYISPLYQFEKLNKTLQNDLLRKYALMLDYAQANNSTIDDETMSTRLKNYVKGWFYHSKEVYVCSKTDEEYDQLTNEKQVEVKVFNEDDNDDVKEAKTDIFTEAYIEYYDIDGDGAISAAESLYSDYYNEVKSPKYGINSAKAHQMAYKLYNDYKAGKLVPKEDGTPEEQFLFAVINKFEFQDITTMLVNRKEKKYTDNLLEFDDVKAFVQALMNNNKEGKSGIIDSSEMRTVARDVQGNNDELYNQMLDYYEKILDGTPE